MATKYKVQEDGKAPSGLSVGSEVVTGGGTYKITGVNADGSYQSTKVADTNTSNYTGSYASVPTTTTTTPAPTMPSGFSGLCTVVHYVGDLNDRRVVRQSFQRSIMEVAQHSFSQFDVEFVCNVFYIVRIISMGYYNPVDIFDFWRSQKRHTICQQIQS